MCGTRRKREDENLMANVRYLNEYLGTFFKNSFARASDVMATRCEMNQWRGMRKIRGLWGEVEGMGAPFCQ